MPCIVFKAADVGATGYEDRDELESDADADLQGADRGDPPRRPGR